MKTQIECDDCGKIIHDEDEMAHQYPDIPDLYERTEPGNVIPAGECPDCGALCFVQPIPAEKRRIQRKKLLKAAAPQLLALVRAYRNSLPKHPVSLQANQVLPGLRSIATKHVELPPKQADPSVPYPAVKPRPTPLPKQQLRRPKPPQ